MVSPVHDRMPVILDPADYDGWLAPGAPVDELRAMLKPCPQEWLHAYAVNRAVNSGKNDDERCIEPVDTAGAAS